jgi:hypothetical protein
MRLRCEETHFQFVKKGIADFCRRSGKTKLNHFRSDMCVNENTYREASVELSAKGGQTRRRAKRNLFVKEVHGLL